MESSYNGRLTRNDLMLIVSMAAWDLFERNNENGNENLDESWNLSDVYQSDGFLGTVV